MKLASIAASIVPAALFVLGCSAAAPVTVTRQQRPVPTEHQAWNAARSRLHSMCPSVPKTETELTQALISKHPNGCYVRLAKDTYLPTIDDWHWHWLPPYRVVAAVHDEELRKRATPRHYEEYMSGLNRYLAEKADRGEITPAQFRYVFTAGWNWLSVKIRNDGFLLKENIAAGSVDSATHSMLNHVAGELATIATLALAVSAPDKKRYEPSPAVCYAHPRQERAYTIECY